MVVSYLFLKKKKTKQNKTKQNKTKQKQKQNTHGRYGDGLRRMATVRATRTCDLLVLVREDLVDVLKLFPRHKARVDAYIAGFPDTFYARNPSLLRRPNVKMRNSGGRQRSYSNVESSFSASDSSSHRESSSFRAYADSPAELEELRSSGVISDDDLQQLDVSNAQLSSNLFKLREAPQGLRRTLLNRFRGSAPSRSSTDQPRVSSEFSGTSSSSPEISPRVSAGAGVARPSPQNRAPPAFMQASRPMNESMMWNLEASTVRPVTKSSANNDIEMLEEIPEVEAKAAPPKLAGPPVPAWRKNL